MRLKLASGSLMALVSAGGANATEKALNCDSMVGVWEYIEPSAPGNAIIAKQGAKYLGIFVNTLREPHGEQTGARTDQPGQVESYAVAGAWEYTCNAAPGGLRLKLRWLYSSYQPKDVGSELSLDVEMAGDQAKWWYIGVDGKRGSMGAGRLVK